MGIELLDLLETGVFTSNIFSDIYSVVSLFHFEGNFSITTKVDRIVINLNSFYIRVVEFLDNVFLRSAMFDSSCESIGEERHKLPKKLPKFKVPVEVKLPDGTKYKEMGVIRVDKLDDVQWRWLHRRKGALYMKRMNLICFKQEAVLLLDFKEWFKEYGLNINLYNPKNIRYILWYIIYFGTLWSVFEMIDANTDKQKAQKNMRDEIMRRQGIGEEEAMEKVKLIEAINHKHSEEKYRAQCIAEGKPLDRWGFYPTREYREWAKEEKKFHGDYATVARFWRRWLRDTGMKQ